MKYIAKEAPMKLQKNKENLCIVEKRLSSKITLLLAKNSYLFLFVNFIKNE